MRKYLQDELDAQTQLAQVRAPRASLRPSRFLTGFQHYSQAYAKSGPTMIKHIEKMVSA